MPKFCIGTDDFKRFVNDKGYFVDKSLLIKEIIDGSIITLLPRPRRFGKTLNMSMLRYFFEKSDNDYTSLYDGLAITKEPDFAQHCGQYPVIYMSLKDIKGLEWSVGLGGLKQKIGKLFRAHMYLQDSLSGVDQKRFTELCNEVADLTTMYTSLKELISYLYEYHQKPVVVLIDEYDSPIIESWKNGYYDEMIDFMRSWLGSALKHEDGNALYRAVITGILRIAKESIFSGLNHITVSSMLKEGAFADMFGFTQSELDQTLEDFELPQLSDEMREWYNGYKFGGHTIYNPWSVINCINEVPNPVGPQWLNTASNTLIYEELERGGLALKQDLEKLLEGKELRYPIVEDTVFDTIGDRPENIWSFLYFAGYLCAEDPKEDIFSGEMTYRLTIPNREVTKVYRDFVRRWHLSVKFSDTQVMLRSLVDEEFSFFEKKLAELTRQLISVHDIAHYPEAAFHGFVLGMLANISNAYEIRSNPETGYGRADILMIPKTKEYPLGFVIEFKSVDKEKDLNSAAEAALAQIDEKAYDSQLVNAGVSEENIRKMAIVIQGKNVKVLS